MKPKWLVENFSGDNGYEELIKEVRNQGMECIVLNITNHFTLQEGIFKSGDCIIFQGSIQLFEKLRSKLGPQGCYPIGWVTDENYLCSTYYPKFKNLLFNDKHVICTVCALKENRFDYYRKFGKEALIFIRPDSGKKIFSGQLLDLQDFDRFWNNSISCSAKDTDLVIVSTPKNINGEWRFICSNKGEIIAQSTYMYQGQRTYIPSAPSGATDLCKAVLSVGWYPDPVFTIDIVEDNDGKFWLMEFNSFTSAGTYAADKKSIVKEVSNIALEQCLIDH